MGITVERKVELKVLECISCSASYAMPEKVFNRHMDEGGYHWCPCCGTSQGWDPKERQKVKTENAEIVRLKESLKWEQTYAREQREAREQAERSLSATKGVVTRMKKRTTAGVCPCCNRHFTALERHMATKHPGFAKEDAE